MYNNQPSVAGMGRRRTVAFFILGIAFIVFLGLYINACHVAAQYDQAPACGGKDTNPSFPACTYESARITNESTDQTVGGRGGHTVYRLDFDNGMTAETADKDFWTAVNPGLQVRIQMWNSNASTLFARGMQAQTWSNPDYQRSHSGQNLLLVFLIGVVGVVSSFFRRWKATSAS